MKSRPAADRTSFAQKRAGYRSAGGSGMRRAAAGGGQQAACDDQHGTVPARGPRAAAECATWVEGQANDSQASASSGSGARADSGISPASSGVSTNRKTNSRMSSPAPPARQATVATLARKAGTTINT